MTQTKNSKMIRISEHLAVEIDRLAKEDRRSLASMVGILLEQALGIRPNPIVTDTPEVVLGAALPHKMDHSRRPKAPPPPVVADPQPGGAAPSYFPEREFRPDPKGKK